MVSFKLLCISMVITALLAHNVQAKKVRTIWTLFSSGKTSSPTIIEKPSTPLLPTYCTPGIDNTKKCGLNTFCNDESFCTPIKEHPYYMTACPYLDGDDTGFCGPELVCNNYRCVHCVNNSTVNHKGLYCSENFWIDSDGQQTAAEHHIVWQILGFLVDVLEAFA